jgi:flagellar biosynthetic protein FliR
MSLIENLLLHQFAAFVLVLARVGALVMTAPAFSSTAIPLQVRGLLAVALSLLIAPLQWERIEALPLNLPELARVLASETLLGLLLGLGVMVLLQGVQVTGHLISQLGGTAIAEAFDPTLDSTASVFSQLLYLLTLAMFLLLDGHREMLQGLLDTYVQFPPGRANLGNSYVDAIVVLLSQSFSLGIRAAGPAMVALLVATLLLGLIGRTLPQINVLAVGFNVNVLLTLGILLLSLGAIAYAFPQQGVAAVRLLRDALR